MKKALVLAGAAALVAIAWLLGGPSSEQRGESSSPARESGDAREAAGAPLPAVADALMRKHEPEPYQPPGMRAKPVDRGGLSRRDHMRTLYPLHDWDSDVGRQQWLDEPLFEQAPWVEAKEEGEIGMLNGVIARAELPDEELLLLSIGGGHGSTLEGELARIFEMHGREEEFEADPDRILLQARATSGGVASIARSLCVMKLDEAVLKVSAGNYDVFEYVTVNEYRVHTQPKEGDVETFFWSGKGWVLTGTLNENDMYGYTDEVAKLHSATEEWLEALWTP